MREIELFYESDKKAKCPEGWRDDNNKKLKIKDIMEWSTGKIKPHDGEIIEQLPRMGVSVAIKIENDKRK